MQRPVATVPIAWKSVALTVVAACRKAPRACMATLSNRSLNASSAKEFCLRRVRPEGELEHCCKFPVLQQLKPSGSQRLQGHIFHSGLPDTFWPKSIQNFWYPQLNSFPRSGPPHPFPFHNLSPDPNLFHEMDSIIEIVSKIWAPAPTQDLGHLTHILGSHSGSLNVDYRREYGTC